MKILKHILLSCLIFFCSACLAQRSNKDTIRLKKIEKIENTTFELDSISWGFGSEIEEDIECRIRYENDSILEKHVMYDVIQNLYSLVNGKIGVYYVNGGNAVLMTEEVNKFMLEKYKIILKHTHCTPCKYQILYSELFNEHYKAVFGEDMHNVILTYDKQAHKKAVETFDKKRK